MSTTGRKLSAVIGEGTITSLVNAFYGRVRQDAILAPVFVRVVGTSEAAWTNHLATLRDFWSSVMLVSGRYGGNPQIAHAKLPDLEPAMFDRWLAIFEQTCTHVLEPDVAVAFIEKANRIGRSLRRGVLKALTEEGS